MKKHLILLFLAGLFTFSSCSNDDDNGTEEKDPIVGTWAVVRIVPPVINVEDCTQTSTITFNDNNSGSAIFYSTETDCNAMNATGEWENKGNDVYSITVPVMGNITGSVDFTSATEFFFVTDNGVTITFQKQ